MFFAAPTLNPHVKVSVSQENGAENHDDSAQVKRLHHAISLPYIQSTKSQKHLKQSGLSPSSSLPQLQSNEDKRIEVELQHKKRVHQQKMRKMRSQQKQTAQKKQQTDLYAQNIRYLKRQQDRGAKDREQLQYEHNGFLRKENAEKKLASKVHKENEAVSKDLVALAEQAQQKANDKVQKIRVERQAQLEAERQEKQKQREEQEAFIEKQYMEEIQKQSRIDHWAKVAPADGDSSTAENGTHLSNNPTSRRDPLTLDGAGAIDLTPKPMHHFISKNKRSKQKAQQQPVAKHSSRQCSKPGSEAGDDADTDADAEARNDCEVARTRKKFTRQKKAELEETERLAKAANEQAQQERRRAKAKAARAQQRAERQQEREMWRRLDEMAVTDGMLNGGGGGQTTAGGAHSGGGARATIEVDWRGLQEQSKHALEEQRQERRLRKEEARRAKADQEQARKAEWEQFLSLERAAGLGMRALVQEEQREQEHDRGHSAKQEGEVEVGE
jgi:hypothetical protein